MARRRHEEEHHEEHMDESWLVPYADILTLLLALFIVLFASAQVDQKKFDQLAEAFSNAFGAGSMSIFDGSRSVPKLQDGAAPGQETPSPAPDPLADVKRQLDQYVLENRLSGLETALVSEGLIIRIKDTALFRSGSAELHAESRGLAAEIARLMATLTHPVVISGHTDNVPINTAQFPSNWHLSSARALNFMLFMMSQDPRIKPERMSSLGYGEYRPIAANNLESGRAQNRRVEILMLRRH